MRKIDLDSERLYENRKVCEPDVRLNQSKYYWAVALPRDEHNKKTCERIAGARVLEIGCSKGDDAGYFGENVQPFRGKLYNGFQ